jgi:hypothetical protein
MLYPSIVSQFYRKDNAIMTERTTIALAIVFIFLAVMIVADLCLTRQRWLATALAAMATADDKQRLREILRTMRFDPLSEETDIITRRKEGART